MTEYRTICTKCFCGYTSVLRRDGDTCGDRSARPQSPCTGKVRRISREEQDRLLSIPGFREMARERIP